MPAGAGGAGSLGNLRFMRANPEPNPPCHVNATPSTAPFCSSCLPVAAWSDAAPVMAERADYLPPSSLQTLAQQVDPRVKLDNDATQVREPTRQPLHEGIIPRRRSSTRTAKAFTATHASRSAGLAGRG